MPEIALDEFSAELIQSEYELDGSRKDPSCKSGLRKISYTLQQYIVITIRGYVFPDKKERLGFVPRFEITASEVKFRIKPGSYKDGDCFE